MDGKTSFGEDIYWYENLEQERRAYTLAPYVNAAWVYTSQDNIYHHAPAPPCKTPTPLTEISTPSHFNPDGLYPSEGAECLFPGPHHVIKLSHMKPVPFCLLFHAHKIITEVAI